MQYRYFFIALSFVLPLLFSYSLRRELLKRFPQTFIDLMRGKKERNEVAYHPRVRRIIEEVKERKVSEYSITGMAPFFWDNDSYYIAKELYPIRWKEGSSLFFDVDKENLHCLFIEKREKKEQEHVCL